MSRLREISQYKNTILQRLVENQNICKAVYYQEINYLEQPEVAIDQVLYNNIFPFPFIPTSDSELKIKKTYITLTLSNYQKAGSVQFKAGNIFINAYTHKDLFRTNYNCLRIDYLISEIDEMLNGDRGIGIGKLEFVGLKDSYFATDYLGSTLQYRPVDFN